MYCAFVPASEESSASDNRHRFCDMNMIRLSLNIIANSNRNSNNMNKKKKFDDVDVVVAPTISYVCVIVVVDVVDGDRLLSLIQEMVLLPLVVIRSLISPIRIFGTILAAITDLQVCCFIIQICKLNHSGIFYLLRKFQRLVVVVYLRYYDIQSMFRCLLFSNVI